MVKIDFKDYYLILGLSKGVSGEEIKRVYCKLVWKYYLDMNFGDCKVEVCFKEVNEVYEVLLDLEKCKKYD